MKADVPEVLAACDPQLLADARRRLQEIMEAAALEPLRHAAPAQPVIPVTSAALAAVVAERALLHESRIEAIKVLAKDLIEHEELQLRKLAYLAGGYHEVEGQKQKLHFGTLEQWAKDHLVVGKRHALTPLARLCFREAPAAVHVPEDKIDALAGWAHRTGHEEVLRLRIEPSLTELKKVIEETGEVPADEQGVLCVDWFPAGRKDNFRVEPLKKD